MDGAALMGIHGLQTNGLAVLEGLLSSLVCQIGQALLPLGAVVLGVHGNSPALVLLTVGDDVHQILDGVQRIAVMTDDGVHVVAGQGQGDGALLHIFLGVDVSGGAEADQQTLEEIHGAAGGSHFIGNADDGRLLAEAQKTGLGLLDDLYRNVVPAHSQLQQSTLYCGVDGIAFCFNILHG